MISIFILIGAFRYYQRLAVKYGKTHWHYGLLSIAIYLGVQLIFGFSYGIYQGLANPESIEQMDYSGFSGVNMVGWIISLFAVWGVYKLLEKRFEKELHQKPSLEIEEIGIKEES